jgi:hypothetical protein
MTQQIPANPPGEEQEAPTCQHHWKIQPATGPVSLGSCKNCGESREFKNYVEASTWGDDKNSNRSAKATTEVKAAVDQSGNEKNEE